MKRIQCYTLFFSLVFGAFIAANAEPLTIVYPDVKAPYDKIFQQITQGIESEFPDKVTHLKLPRKFDAKEIAKKITTNKMIALGKRGMMIAKQVYLDMPVVVGALPIKPNGISGVSLMASPNVLFHSLNKLAPKVTTVTVLYTGASAWIIDVAKAQAKLKGLTLNPIPVDDIATAVKAYDEIFSGKNLDSMAIWLPLDPVTANDKIIVPVILEKAWANKWWFFPVNQHMLNVVPYFQLCLIMKC